MSWGGLGFEEEDSRGGGYSDPDHDGLEESVIFGERFEDFRVGGDVDEDGESVFCDGLEGGGVFFPLAIRAAWDGCGEGGVEGALLHTA